MLAESRLHVERRLRRYPRDAPSGFQRACACFDRPSDGSGNPICLDTARDGALLWFDHETELAHECYVNASVVQLAEFLLLRMVDPKARYSSSSYAAIEPDALLPGTFWHAQGNR